MKEGGREGGREREGGVIFVVVVVVVVVVAAAAAAATAAVGGWVGSGGGGGVVGAGRHRVRVGRVVAVGRPLLQRVGALRLAGRARWPVTPAAGREPGPGWQAGRDGRGCGAIPVRRIPPSKLSSGPVHEDPGWRTGRTDRGTGCGAISSAQCLGSRILSASGSHERLQTQPCSAVQAWQVSVGVMEGIFAWKW